MSPPPGRLKEGSVPLGGKAHGAKTRIDDAYHAFNDVNAMMAFAGAGNAEAQERQIETMKRAGTATGTNAMMSGEIGVPACEGFAAFGRGDYAQTIELLFPLRAKANLFGGNHAKRDCSFLLCYLVTDRDVTCARALCAEAPRG